MPGMRTIDCIMRQVFASAALAVLRSVARNVSDFITVKANNVLTVLNEMLLWSTFSTGLRLIIICNMHLIFTEVNQR